MITFLTTTSNAVINMYPFTTTRIIQSWQNIVMRFFCDNSDFGDLKKYIPNERIFNQSNFSNYPGNFTEVIYAYVLLNA